MLLRTILKKEAKPTCRNIVFEHIMKLFGTCSEIMSVVAIGFPLGLSGQVVGEEWNFGVVTWHQHKHIPERKLVTRYVFFLQDSVQGACKGDIGLEPRERVQVHHQVECNDAKGHDPRTWQVHQ